MMRTPTVRNVSFTALLLVGACSLAPDYQVPDIAKPEAFKEAVAAAKVPQPEGGAVWSPANPQSADAPRGPWWEAYDDKTLNELEAKVTDANQNLKLAVAQYDQARETANAARASLFPTLGAIAGYGRASTVVPAGANNTNAAAQAVSASGNVLRNKERLLGGQLSYELDVFGRVRNTLDAASSEAQATKADLAAIDLALHAELASNYFALRGADEATRILDKTIASYQQAFDLTRNRFEGGVAGEQDVDQARTQLENAKTQAADRRLQRERLEHAIAVLTGQPPANFTLAPAPFVSKPITVTAGLPSQLLERRPDIAAAALRTEAANANVGVARAAYFPTFNLTGTGGYQSTIASQLFDSSSFFWSLGTTALVNVFDGGRIEALSDRAKAAYEASAASYRQTVLTAYQEVEDSLSADRALHEQQQSQNAASASAKRNLAHANDRYTGGITTYLEVSVAQNTTLTNELLANDIRTRHLAANVDLIRALGGGWTGETK